MALDWAGVIDQQERVQLHYRHLCDLKKGTALTMQIAPQHTYDQVIEAEVAIEIVNRARALLYARIYEIEATQPDQAKRLQEKAHELYVVLRGIKVADDENVKAITEYWGRLTKDETAFWAVMNG